MKLLSQDVFMALLLTGIVLFLTACAEPKIKGEGTPTNDPLSSEITCVWHTYTVDVKFLDGVVRTAKIQSCQNDVGWTYQNFYAVTDETIHFSVQD